MNHSLSAPDLYHYSYTGPDAVGVWDLMHANATPPQHCGAYMKMKYGHWVDEIPEITQAGTYTLNPISSPTPTNIAYKIQSDDPNQFYVLEYRDNTSLFETALPGSGLLIYRIDTRFGGNADYDPSNGIYDEVYLFRPGGSTSANGSLNNAYFNASVGRTEFNFSTNAYPFFSEGTLDNNFSIFNITEAGNTISFSYGSSSDCEPPTNLVSSIDNNSVSLSWDPALNALSYNIYRNNSLIGNTSETSYLDSNLGMGNYTYFLKSVDANGLLSSSSETVTASILPEGTVIIGDGSGTTNDVLPSYSYYNYSLTQQIYTAQELGEMGIITGIAFYNNGSEKTRNYVFYMKETEKDSFSSNKDWESITDANRVFSGNVTMATDAWTYIEFDTPFLYDGVSNIVLVTDDNSGSWSYSPHMSCLVFNATNQSIHIYNDNENYDPFEPDNYTGQVQSVKNQLLVTKISPPTGSINVTVTAHPLIGGSVSGGGTFSFGETCTVTAIENENYQFEGWTENGQVVSMDLEYSFIVVQDRELVANFTQSILIGDGGTSMNQYLPSYSYYNYSLTQQIYTAEEIGTECMINSIAFYNGGTVKTRNYDMYLVHTDKTGFNNNNDWITVTEDDKVFSNTVTMVANNWTVFVLDTPFKYDGTSNLALVMDDNTGSYSSGMNCRVFDAPSQAIRIYSDGTNYNPFTPSSYSGTVMSVKNQIILGILPLCFEPTNLTSSNITSNSAELHWIADLDSYNVRYRTVPDGPWIETVAHWDRFTDDFENGLSQWTLIDADGDGRNWELLSDHEIQDASPYEGEEMVNSFSWDLGFVMYPDNYLVTPQVNLGKTITFWASAVDPNFAAEHFGIAVSTSGNTDPNDFTMVQEWTMTAKSNGHVGPRGNRSQGTWYQYVVDLSAYEGETGYIAIRHFDSNNQYVLSVDDFSYCQEGALPDGIVLSGLDSETTYEVQVQGICPNGLTEWSESTTFTTLASPTTTQTIALSMGWNYISANVEITLDDLENALVMALPGTSITIKGQSASTRYIPTQNAWVGSLTEEKFDIARLYMVSVANAAEIVLEGIAINAEEHPVTIPANGSVWFAYPLNESKTPAVVFSDFGINGDVIKGQFGSARCIGTNWVGTLTTLLPGQGYIYTSKASQDRTLVFPSSK